MDTEKSQPPKIVKEVVPTIDLSPIFSIFSFLVFTVNSGSLSLI